MRFDFSISMSQITKIEAREILNSGATASIEVKITLADGATGKASAPFGASTGVHEAFVLFDGGRRYGGQGMLKAARNVKTEIKKALIGQDAYNQEAIDQKMIALDGTENKSRLGSNAILAVSMAVARAAADSQKVELYQYIRKISNFKNKITNISLPAPMIVIIEGGKHADNSTDFQEYLIVPQIKDKQGQLSIKDSVRAGAEVYLELKKVLQEKGYNTNVGNEGAYAPAGMKVNAEPWDLILEAIERAGYQAGQDIKLAADPACSEIVARAKDEAGLQYQLPKEGRIFSSEELIDYFTGWVEEYPFICLEDILAEDDWENWIKAQARLGKKVRLIGDDLLVTNHKRLKKAIQKKACNAILIKLNQIGTLSETIKTIKLAHENNFWTIVSHRGGGETNDTAMIDLAVACGCQMVKVGIARGERVEKYNRLMEIEEQIKE